MHNHFIAAALAVGVGALTATAPAQATPGQALIGAETTALGHVQPAAFLDRAERRLRRNGYRVIPPTAPAPPAVVAGGTALVPAGPMRPSSCGEYHYWNGVACVDARYYDPDVTPEP